VIQAILFSGNQNKGKNLFPEKWTILGIAPDLQSPSFAGTTNLLRVYKPIFLYYLTGIDSSRTNLFFYIQDPSDVGATTTIGTNVDFQEYSFAGEPNGGSYFVGITLGLNETLSQISWTATTAGDGFGLDDFSTVSPVPEPATMFLFGTGLAGLAGLYRRKIS